MDKILEEFHERLSQTVGAELHALMRELHQKLHAAGFSQTQIEAQMNDPQNGFDALRNAYLDWINNKLPSFR